MPAFYQGVPQGQGIYNFGGSGMANPVAAYNTQFGYNVGGQLFTGQPANLNVMRADLSEFNEAGGNHLKVLQLTPAKKLEITTHEFLACAEGGVENGAKNSMPSNGGVLKLSNASSLFHLFTTENAWPVLIIKAAIITILAIFRFSMPSTNNYGEP